MKTAFLAILTAEATPANPKKGAYGGHSSDDITVSEYMVKCCRSEFSAPIERSIDARSRAESRQPQ